MSGYKNNLKEKVDLVLVQRKISQKELIFECSCSRSHFNKVVNGERKAGTALQKRMVKALCLTDSETTFFFNYDDSVLCETDLGESNTYLNIAFKSIQHRFEQPKRKNAVLSIAVIFSLLFVALLYKGTINSEVHQPAKTKNMLKNDWSTFVKDISIPDGTTLKVNSHHVKTWRLKNSGKHVWRGRYLKRLTPHSNLLCSSASMVPIGETSPGEVVDISIKFKTPHIPGSCRLDFKMTDKLGQLYFPNLHSVYLLVNVAM
ncbi:NBR1-Ig-like domain-containing protein [Pseudoalteromonas aliena]|uniref:NBR1-Ig-like domain-containing protein n=1 Tax=Pseudoalteromonas aliena TaxID=247523 RepID=UPI001EEE8245|nr:NBR1-Ig-like domain-containing protein [Pseudoalteromonas aliena]